jgi:hypothetical protein
MTPIRNSLVLTVCALLLQGCIFLPEVTETQEPDCAEPRKRVSIESSSISEIEECDGVAYAGCMMLGGVIIWPASAIVTGTVATVGNAAYWVEHQVECG